MMWGSGSFIWRKFVASASCGRGWYWDGPLEDAGADGYTVAIGTTGHSGVAMGGVAVWAVGASSLTRGSSSSSFSMPPSLSSMSTLVPGGTKAHLMKVNSAVAHSMLCGTVANFAFARQVLMACWRCHQKRLIFGFHTSRAAPISAISLSLWMKTGLTPYVSQRHLDQAAIAFFCFLASTAVAIDKRQYVKGNPALSYSPIIL